uniref:PPM-type phosphatase domain-containing protein n=1 Tax=Cynoglossus semilaevis TaxID=244447 RepID=A0A3P8V711_CYNSE
YMSQSKRKRTKGNQGSKSEAPFSLDFIIRDRLVSWESLGIWDNRIEDPIVLPSSVINGTPIPQVNLSLVGCSSVLGLRKQNEDRLRVARLQDNLLYFAVFDGHGGPHAADFCYTFMEKFIRDALEKEDNLEKVLKKAFVDVDKGLHTHLSYFNTGERNTDTHPLTFVLRTSRAKVSFTV